MTIVAIASLTALTLTMIAASTLQGGEIPTVTEWSPSTGSQETWQTSLPAQCKFAMKNVMSCFHMSMCCMNKAFS